MQLLKDTWTSFGAEVIFITSNKQDNDEMMRDCQEGVYDVCVDSDYETPHWLPTCALAGLHTFGILWDF